MITNAKSYLQSMIQTCYPKFRNDFYCKQPNVIENPDFEVKPRVEKFYYMKTNVRIIQSLCSGSKKNVNQNQKLNRKLQ
jgi:hypothetical protein